MAELRNERSKREENINNYCFICNVERNKFERHGEGFELHSRRDHNLWNYVYLVWNIESKPVTELNGIESYVHDKVTLLCPFVTPSFGNGSD